MDDLISRQDVFDMIDAVFREECEKRNTTYEEADEMTQWYLCGMMKVMEKVFDIPSAYRWIPVSERLPEEGQSCLVTQAVVNGMRIVIIATFTSDLYKFDIYDFAGREGEHGWVRYDDEYGRYYDVDVLAWMPLPEPYKEEE